MINENGKSLDFYVDDEIRLRDLTEFMKKGMVLEIAGYVIDDAGEQEQEQQEEEIELMWPTDMKRVLVLARQVSLYPPRLNDEDMSAVAGRSLPRPATWSFIHGTPNCMCWQ